MKESILAVDIETAETLRFGAGKIKIETKITSSFSRHSRRDMIAITGY